MTPKMVIFAMSVFRNFAAFLFHVNILTMSINHVEFLRPICRGLIMRCMTSIVMLLISSVIMSAAAPVDIHRIGIKEGLPTKSVTDITQDKRGIIWIGSQAGLIRFDGYTFTQYSVPTKGVVGNTIETLYYDKRDDRLWIGTRSGIMTLKCEDLRFEAPDFPQEMLEYNISRIVPASDGGIWILCHYHRIIHVDGEGKPTLINNSRIKGMPADIIDGVDDGKGNLIVTHETDGISIIDMTART